MGGDDYEALVKALQTFGASHAATPEQAFTVLREEGVLTEEGEFTDAYAEPADA